MRRGQGAQALQSSECLTCRLRLALAYFAAAGAAVGTAGAALGGFR